MSDDLEQRLRDTLRAYADAVHAPDGTLPARPAPARPRRWRGAVLGAAAAAAVVVGSLVVVDAHDRGRGSAADVAAGSSASRAGESAGPASDEALSAPAGGSALADAAQPGASFPVDLSTHCGVRGLDIGGVWFAADPPLVVEDGPPAGWSNPRQPGTVTLLSATKAVFADDLGHQVRLRADESARPPLCE